MIESQDIKYSIIISYRDREEHLSILLPQLKDIFLNKSYEIIIAEQDNNEKFQKNSLYNIGTDFGRIIDFWTGDSAALDIASAAMANSIFGEENVEEFIKENKSSEFLIEGLGTQEILEKIPEREKEKQLRKPTLEIIESFKEGEFLEGGAAIASAFLNTIGSAAYGVATAGAGFFMDYAADNYIEYNKGLAKRKGKSLEQLIQDDEAKKKLQKQFQKILLGKNLVLRV